MNDSGMEDTGSNGQRSNGQRSDDNGPDGTAAQQDAGAGLYNRHGLARYARPALIAGIAIAIVCVALLVIIFFLDSFNATVYSVGGNDIKDATDEAASIRNAYAAARLGGIIFLVAGVILAAAGGLVMYRHRNEAGRDRGGADGEDVDFEDLAGQ
jgi:ABC-type Fe3+ transport system permease subunit